MSGYKLSSKAIPAIRGYKFPRSYRLKKQKYIRPLFDQNRKDVGTISVGCIRLIYRTVPRVEIGSDAPVITGFTASRRRTAVTRNRIKRVLREVYRMHQSILVDLFARSDESLSLMLLYRGHTSSLNECVSCDLPEALRRLADQIQSDRVP